MDSDCLGGRFFSPGSADSEPDSTLKQFSSVRHRGAGIAIWIPHFGCNKGDWNQANIAEGAAPWRWKMNVVGDLGRGPGCLHHRQFRPSGQWLSSGSPTDYTNIRLIYCVADWLLCQTPIQSLQNLTSDLKLKEVKYASWVRACCPLHSWLSQRFWQNAGKKKTMSMKTIVCHTLNHS